jgi:hypothetical protein
MAVNWLDQPEDHDYGAAGDYLSMVAEPPDVEKTLAALRTAQPVYRSVRADLGKISTGKTLSPILLLRGDVFKTVKLEIADGYHRVCASYLNDENTNIPCHLVSWQG